MWRVNKKALWLPGKLNFVSPVETGKRLKSAFPGQAWFHLTVPSSQWWCISWNITKSNPEQRVTGNRLVGTSRAACYSRAQVGFSHLNVRTSVPAQLRINGSTGEILMWEGGCKFNGLEWINYTASKDLLNKKLYCRCEVCSVFFLFNCLTGNQDLSCFHDLLFPLLLFFC